MRYRIPEEDYGLLSRVVSDVFFDFDGTHYITTEVKKIKKFKSRLDNLARANGYSDFTSWFSLFVQTPYKIYSLMRNKPEDVYALPKDVDFKTQLLEKLQKKLLPKESGKPTVVEYYEIKKPLTDEAGNPTKNFLGQQLYEYENLIAQIDFDFKFDEFGFIDEKIAMLRWYDENGRLSEEGKNLGRVFDPINDHEARIAEGEIRRRSIIHGLQLPVMNKLKEIYDEYTPIQILSIGRQFLNNNDEVFRDFIDKSLSVVDENSVDYGKKVAWVTIRDYSGDEDDWLDYDLGDGETIRQFIMEELDI